MVNRIDQANAQSTSNITNMVEEMNNLRAEIAALKKNKSKGIVEIPPGLSKSVHVAYGPLKENGWNFELKFNSIINEQVNSSILTAIKDGGLDHDLKVRLQGDTLKAKNVDGSYNQSHQKKLRVKLEKTVVL